MNEKHVFAEIKKKVYRYNNPTVLSVVTTSRRFEFFMRDLIEYIETNNLQKTDKQIIEEDRDTMDIKYNIYGYKFKLNSQSHLFFLGT